jgi:hypothetical protein
MATRPRARVPQTAGDEDEAEIEEDDDDLPDEMAEVSAACGGRRAVARGAPSHQEGERGLCCAIARSAQGQHQRVRVSAEAGKLRRGGPGRVRAQEEDEEESTVKPAKAVAEDRQKAPAHAAHEPQRDRGDDVQPFTL